MRRQQWRKCCGCWVFFKPDRRNAKRQKYCPDPACRKLSKAHSQRKWSSKPENEGHFRGSVNTERVRAWRKAHPGYWRKKKKMPDALQDSCDAQNAEQQEIAATSDELPLQDLFQEQPALLVGVISTMCGHALQDTIAPVLRSMLARGRDILAGPNASGFASAKVGAASHHEIKTTSPPRPAQARASPV